MIPKIYARSSPPWENGGSTVDRFESGLIKVTQEYLCPTSQREEIASGFVVGDELKGIASPASDGIYIYPSPQSSDLNNGFSKISVSAYGRALSYLAITVTYNQVAIKVLDQTITFLAPNYRIVYVTRSGEIPIPPNLSNLLYRDPIYRSEGGQFSISDFQREITFTASPATGYGEMQEQVYNIAITPKDSSLQGGVEIGGGAVVIIDPPIIDPPAE